MPLPSVEVRNERNTVPRRRELIVQGPSQAYIQSHRMKKAGFLWHTVGKDNRMP